MGSPSNYPGPPYHPYYPPQPTPLYNYPPYPSTSCPNPYHDRQPRSTPFQGQSYYGQLYRPEFQGQVPLTGRVTEIIPPIYQSCWSDQAQNRTGRRMLFEMLQRPPEGPLSGFNQEYPSASQLRESGIASGYSSTSPSIPQAEGTLSYFLKEKCSSSIPSESVENSVDLATMFKEFDQIYTLSHPISREYVKKIARLRCSETGRQEYKGSSVECNSGDTLFNIFARVVNQAHDLNYRDQLKRNMELIANLTDLFARDNNSDSPIFHACSKATHDQDKSSSQGRTSSENIRLSQRTHTSDPQEADLKGKRKRDSREIPDEQTLPTKNNTIQTLADDKQTPIDKRPQQKNLKWVEANFNEENRAPAELNQSKPRPSAQRKKRPRNPDARPSEKAPEKNRRSHQRKRPTTLETSQVGAKSTPINLSIDDEEENIAPEQAKRGFSFKILPQGKTATSSSHILTERVEPQSERIKSDGENNSLTCDESVGWSPIFVAFGSDVSEKSQETPPVANFFPNPDASINDGRGQIKIPKAIRRPPPDVIEIKAPSKGQSSQVAGKLSTGSYVDEILRQEEGSQRQLPPIKKD